MPKRIDGISKKIFDHAPSCWQQLEAMVQQAFAEMGYEAHGLYKLETVRGTVEVDVYAKKRSSPIPTIVLCECKYWNKPVPQNVIHGFRTVYSDAGAHFGIIISKKGFQPGAKKCREATNVHLMNFLEFQETFFEEWRVGATMMLQMMCDQMLPIFRASGGLQERGLDIIDKEAINGVDVGGKYSLFFGADDLYSLFFILSRPFPAVINDPRGAPRRIAQITVHSHREYLEIAREAVVEATKRFNLPAIYYDDSGRIKDTILWGR